MSMIHSTVAVYVCHTPVQLAVIMTGILKSAASYTITIALREVGGIATSNDVALAILGAAWGTIGILTRKLAFDRRVGGVALTALYGTLIGALVEDFQPIHVVRA